MSEYKLTKDDFPQFWIASFYRGGMGNFPCNEDMVIRVLSRYKAKIKDWNPTPFIDEMLKDKCGGYKFVAKLFFRKGSNYKGMIYCKDIGEGEKLIKRLDSLSSRSD